MTRASLLHILDNLGGISETEVQELEQLAATFPYCQTAHLLLAKAAHDRGSMLAAQRLRRAATYAVDREQLRALIELPAPQTLAEAFTPSKEEQAEAVATAQLALAVPPSVDIITAEPELLQAADYITSPETDSPNNQPLDGAYDTGETDVQDTSSTTTELEADLAIAEEAPAEPSASEAALLNDTPETRAHASVEAANELETPLHEVDAQLPEELLDSDEAIINADLPAEEEPVEESVKVEADIAASTEESDAAAPELTLEQPIEQPFIPTGEREESVVAPELEVEPEFTEEELPLSPPPIRPPAEVGSSRFEFGLAQTLPVPTYNLFEVEKAAKQTAVIPPFWADEEVGYAPGLGSRLGFCLQAHDEYSLDLPPALFLSPMPCCFST
ncbi:hypothetical protein H9L05_15870 [Hymenobacter qilianensis]|uniref:Uncharacterized protein n=1 Tax=Hymenobacter qilianensis TaxID=1385715 RepID=A0A7H0GT67_9BACT|nr:hypothetical protein [Hymenobacter qilianensis]QNP51483.1 hypothetical protein H9L05_15870 [Hymenobacter qilianensis]